ncbi:MAG: phosphohydrolase [Oscillospiraceae bacterium]|nr:phosphohydrolase [Oscillospiraceae bacterium]
MSEIMEKYEHFKSLVTKRKDEFTSLMNFVENETAYLSAPASTRYHLNHEGGLLEHSVNVCEALLKLRLALSPGISEESCVVVALLHDLGKAGVPGKPLYLPNTPTQKQKEYGIAAPFRMSDRLTYMSVPVRSLYLIGPRFPLTEDEAQAIVYHDGQYVDDNHSVAAKEKPLLLLLHYADNWSSFVTEKRSNR